jgi:Putative DNA-binding domain
MTSELLLTDGELVTRLSNFEDPFVERKTEGDLKDCLKTAVAFANSLPDGVPGVLFIPATDKGAVQSGVNLDNLQKKISARLADVYPPIQYFSRLLTVGPDQVIAVHVWGSPERPHFSGPSYIRDGSQTKKASDHQFAELIARRSSKAAEISKWINKRVTVEFVVPGTGPRLEQRLVATVLECNQWYLTFGYSDARPRNMERESIPLNRVQISYDQGNRWLALEIKR